MKIENNPFTTLIFEQKWMKHFMPSKKVQSFEFIEGVRFYKPSYFPIFINTGKNLTKGNYYEINNAMDFSGKVFVIYDVPSYQEIKNSSDSKNDLKLHRIKQYEGFLIDLEKYSTINEYLLATFSKNTRMKFRKYVNRLESCFKISSTMYLGNIDKKEYDYLFEQFMNLLVKRYSKKAISYNNMEPKEWRFYKDVAYSLILEKKASLFVLYNGELPIAITYSYHTDISIIDAITVFDIDYTKFNLGYVNNLKLIEWCLQNNIRLLDFSKGYFFYKKRFGNLEYNFEYHVYYDDSSILSRTYASLLKRYFELKQDMRDKKINEKLHKITYWLKNRTAKREKKISYETIEKNQYYTEEQLISIDMSLEENQFLKSIVFDFLYLNSEQYKDLKVFKESVESSIYLLKGKTKATTVKIVY